MPSPATIDFDQLLAPIPGDADTGIDLRKDETKPSPYWRIKALRNTSRVAEAAAAKGETPDQPADWKSVLAQGLQLLGQKSKDLEIVTYVIEALVRLHGVPGLRDGFRLARELIERYWDSLYPDPQLEEGVIERVAALAGLGGDSDREGSLAEPINRFPVADSRTQGRFYFSQHRDAVALDRMPDSQQEAKERKIADGAVTLERLARAAADTPAAFYRQQVEDLTGCLDEFTQMTEALDQRCGLDSPPSSVLRDTLEAYRTALEALGGDKAKLDGAEAAEPAATGDGEPAAATGGGPLVPGVIRSREEALESLLKVAEFFRRTEPHSVLYAYLKRAVRWGRMPLTELLVELIPEEAAREGFFRLAGIESSSSSSPSYPETPSDSE